MPKLMTFYYCSFWLLKYQHLWISVTGYSLHSITNYLKGYPVLLTDWWRYRSAWSKWITSTAFWAAAGWYMVNYITTSTLSTGSRAWVYTALIITGSVPWTFSIHSAFRTAVGIRVSEVVCETCALTSVTKCIGTTWWWIAWIGHIWFLNCEWHKRTLSKWQQKEFLVYNCTSVLNAKHKWNFQLSSSITICLSIMC